MREIMMRVFLMMMLMTTASDGLSQMVVSEIRLQYRTMVTDFLRTVKVKITFNIYLKFWIAQAR